MSDLTLEIGTDGVAVLTLNRPGRRNAVTLEMWRGIARILSELEQRQEVRALVLTGAKGHFSAGAELGEYADGTAGQATAMEDVVDASVARLTDWPRPTVAAVEGVCVGGGMMLATACDFRVAAPDARFAVPVARLGNVYRVGACEGLVRAVGPTHAKRLLFSAEAIDAAEALRIGLTEATDPDPVAAARRLLAVMIDKAPLTIAAAKRAVNAIARGDGKAVASEILSAGLRAVETEDFREGGRAFREKRRPVFTGR